MFSACREEWTANLRNSRTTIKGQDTPHYSPLALRKQAHEEEQTPCKPANRSLFVIDPFSI